MNPGDEILPCPYCGSEVELQDDKDDTYCIVCLHCEVSAEGPNPLHLIRVWNESAKSVAETKAMKVPFNYLGPDPEPDSDPDVWLTDELQCSDCGFQFDIETIEHFFDVDESGVQPGTVHGPAVHWARGFVICPGCSAGLPYETSS